MSAPFLTPGAGRLRTTVERRSAPVVVWLAYLPRLLPIAVFAALFLLAAFVGGVFSGLILLLIAAVMGLISYLSWPSVPPVLRAVRLVVLIGVIAFALSRLA
ncbi:hypothetical protein acdb102_35090 [Acidothermaceae bacterium B102]|nr:hypothetical protein acdb102_35090 [Acidothermaceae bacterium B102]